MNKRLIRCFIPFFFLLFMLATVSEIYSIVVEDQFTYLPIVTKPDTTYPGWIKNYEPSYIYDFVETSDGHYVVVGYSANGTYPGWSAKLDAQGQPIWMNVQQIGGSLSKVYELSNRDLMIIGSSDIYEIITIASHQPNGSRIWGKSIDMGSSFDSLQDSYLTVDEGLVLVGGETYHSYILRMDHEGNLLWQKDFNDVTNYTLTSVQQTADKGFILSGYTDHFEADNWAGWVLRLDENGDILWQKIYDAPNAQYIYKIRETKDGDYLAVGKHWGDSLIKGWIMKLDKNGEPLWSYAYPRTDSYFFVSLEEVANDNFVIGANIEYTSQPGFILQINGEGEIIWQRKIDIDWFSAGNIHQNTDGGLTVSGYSYLVHLDAQGQAPDCDYISSETGLTETYPITVTNTAATLTPSTLSIGPSNWYIVEELTSPSQICPQVDPLACK